MSRRKGTEQGRFLAGLRASNAAGLHDHRTARGEAERDALAAEYDAYGDDRDWDWRYGDDPAGEDEDGELDV